jgi:hypothetical protein
MAVTEQIDAVWRWTLSFSSPQTFADDLGSVGCWVGPRTGPMKRTRGQKEDYILRRVLVALHKEGRLEFPFDVLAEPEPGRDGEPDFLLRESSGRIVGMEVTEAGKEDYQAWLTRTEDLRESGDAVLEHGDRYVPRIETDAVAAEIHDAIERKTRLYDSGKYQSPGACDLAIYDNTRHGAFLDKREILRALGRPEELLAKFRRVHIVFGEFVSLDTFGNDAALVDISSRYEIDYAKWIFEQVDKLRKSDIAGLDAKNIAEELEDLGRSQRRALGGHLRNLLLHLLKWKYQSDRRSESWRHSIANARSEIDELLTEMPSLRQALRQLRDEQYQRARRDAAAETGLELALFPEQCEFDLKTEILDDEFIPA